MAAVVSTSTAASTSGGCDSRCSAFSRPAALPSSSFSPPPSLAPALFWNLRHCRALGTSDLIGIPPTVERLWLGPSFDPLLTFPDLAQCIPDSLVELDLDLTALLLLRGEETVDEGENNDDSDHAAATAQKGEEDYLVRTAKKGLQILFRRLTRLKTLTLRLPDPHADVLVARAVAECLPDTSPSGSSSSSSSLTSLNLRQGPVGVAGVIALGSALHRQQRATAATTLWGGPSARLRELSLDCGSSGSSNRNSSSATTTATATETAHALARLLSSGGCGAALRRLDVGCSGGGGAAGGDSNGDDDDDGWTDAALAPLCAALRDNRTLTDLGLCGCDARRVTALTGVRLLDALRDNNATLERLTWHDVSSVPPALLLEVDWYLRLNRAGRRYLREDPPLYVEEKEDRGESESVSSAVSSAPSALPLTLWPRLLARIAQSQSSSPSSSASVLFYFVRHKVDLLLCRP